MTVRDDAEMTAGGGEDQRRRTVIAIIPFAIAAPSLIVAAILGHAALLPPEANAIALAAVFAILVFDLPVCAVVIIQWLATGEPPALSLSPIIPCREEREFYRRLGERPKLSDDEFYNRFYGGTSVPRQLPIRLRTLLATQLGMDLAALHPDDNLTHADEEIPWLEVVYEINEEFRIASSAETLGGFDGTFDFLLRRIVEVSESDGTTTLVDG